MALRGPRRHLLVAGAACLALATGAAGSRPAQDPSAECTHGASSIGPVVLDHGRVVGGSTTPVMEACLR